MKRTIAAVILVLFACNWAFAESSVWKAQKGNAVIYLGGTCHVLRQSDFPLPPEFAKAYGASQVVVFEADPGELQDPAMQKKALARSIYPDGSTIDKHLSPDTYAQLAAYCQANNIPLAALRQFKVSVAMVSLTFLELMKLGVDQKGVDYFFYELAKKEGKKVEALESADEQLEALVTIADGNEDEFVSYAIRDLGTLKERFAELAGAWRTGDTVKLNELLVSQLRTEDPKEYQKLVVDRNRKWLPAILGYHASRQTRLVLVGAAHLVGPDGILEALKKKGYRVEKL
ncbi:TraB/GumN family protein [Geomonas sp.]|uniref:TraB/GumN family protein n=1 Tax=Geomonas sp. TaxID=2651584 RepID=UPI002B4A601A|nr:TraB/GumN family protein [Geomonas sp.]HJV35738.1 TraB/GumN family protein [Geomonas sp.]